MVKMMRFAVASVALVLSSSPVAASTAQPVPSSVIRADAVASDQAAELRGRHGYGAIAVAFGVIFLITIILVTRGGKSP